MDWLEDLRNIVSAAQAREPKSVIDDIVGLSASIADDELATSFRNGHPPGSQAATAKEIYHKYILNMENTALTSIFRAAVGPGTRFCDVADPEARTAFDRVADIFDRLSLHPGVRFVMVGCGQLPVTAIHVMERAGCEHIVCMDVVEGAIASVERLKRAFGWNALHPIVCDGAAYDFAKADAVYIANMVSPKAAVVEQVARTAPPGCQIVIREPYGLGRLWAEQAEANLPDCFAVSGYGPGSRYLSRDMFVSWR